MPRNRLTVLVGAVAVLVLVGASFAVANDHGSKTGVRGERLIGYNEVPPISTTAKGSFTGRIDPVAKTLTYTLTYSGLSSNALFAHIHFGQKGVAGGISAFLCGGGGKPACQNSPGTAEGDVTAANVIGPTGQGVAPGEFDEAIRAMRAGYAYANVHTTTYATGEIRGQINSHSGEKRRD